MNASTKTAKKMAEEAREISISEFFQKNRHLLGYDNKIKALLTIVKEGVDNALDATEEARILPDIYIKVEELDKEKFKIVIKDNGPGIMKKQIPKIFGKLLYGSKFHRLKQNRGQQGIGVSGCVLYSQLTSGEPTRIISSTGDGKTHKYALKIDVKQNEPRIMENEVVNSEEKWHGVQITFVAEGIYREHKQSVIEYLKEVAISNPYANIIFDGPNGRVEFARGSETLPPEPKAIKPHLHGVEVGILSRMLHDTKARSVSSFLTSEFSRVGRLTAEEICKKADVDPKISPRKIAHEEVLRLIGAIKEVKLTRPPTDCLSPLGSELIEEGMKKELNPEFVATISRHPSVYRGWPFVIETGIAYGGSITEPRVMRFANRVPLLYQQGDCAITKSVTGVEWRRYGLSGSNIPEAPVVIFVHMASVWVPFTSESKEAIANYPVIIKEVRLALQEVARKLSIYLGRKTRGIIAQKRREMFKNYIGEIAVALSKLTGEKEDSIKKKMLDMAESMYDSLGLDQEFEETEAEEAGQDVKEEKAEKENSFKEEKNEK